MKYRDETVLEKACEVFLKSGAKGTTTNAQSLTNLLYVLSKFKYTPMTGSVQGEPNAFMTKCAGLLKAEPSLPVELACRNLWHFYSLNHYDPALLDSFGTIIVKNHDKLSEVDIANAVRAFAHFKHVESEQAGATLESLVRSSIKHV